MPEQSWSGGKWPVDCRSSQAIDDEYTLLRGMARMMDRENLPVNELHVDSETNAIRVKVRSNDPALAETVADRVERQAIALRGGHGGIVVMFYDAVMVRREATP